MSQEIGCDQRAFSVADDEALTQTPCTSERQWLPAACA